jgi:Peptidase A4 family
MKRLLCLAAAGLMCGASILGASGVAGASSVPARSTHLSVQPGGLLVRAPGFAKHDSSSPTVSINWSGYGALSSTKKFNYVHATFVQPAVKCDGVKNQLTSNWVGIDGYNDQTVEQDGTSVQCGGPNGMTPEYEAWYEMFPGPSANVFRVNPGDIIDISVTYASGSFTMAETDLTTGKTSSVTAKNASAKRDSAEWVIERPAFCNSTETKCFLTELANYGTTSMSGATASVDGGPVQSVGHFNNSPIYMFCPITRGFISLDTVSPLSGPSFSATWDRSGTTTPITLAPKR